MNGSLSVAISPCPNDSFIFAAWILGLAPEAARIPARFTWADVEELNQAAEARRFDVVKLSAAAALGLTDSYEILPSGAAFGLGAGPKLVARPDAPARPRVVAVPGLRTTALAVLRAAMDEPFEAKPMLFSDIVAAVQAGRADAGLLIHETALAPERHGLEIRLDLGAWWADATNGAPLPLGVIAARRDLPGDVRQGAARAIRASMEQARTAPESILPLVRILAQELDEAILAAHIEAYVNDLSLDMGGRGREALKHLEAMVRGA
ncbi:1,4-dihydroxy-6-naphthoate synthase [Desulfocurvus sp. DL9XJH121]